VVRRWAVPLGHDPRLFRPVRASCFRAFPTSHFFLTFPLRPLLVSVFRVKTDLSGAFSGIYQKNDGKWETFSTPDEYNKFLRAVAQSPVTKTWARARAESDLWLIPKIALLCSETALISAAHIGRNLRMKLLWSRQPKSFTLPLELKNKLTNKVVHTGFVYPDKEVLERWFRDAEPLVTRGQLIYLPERILMTADSDVADSAGVAAPFSLERARGRKWQVETLDNREEWNILKPDLPGQQNSNSLITTENGGTEIKDIIDLMGISVPLILAMSLTEFSNFLAEDGDCVITFRAAIRKALNDAASLKRGATDPRDIRGAVSQIRADIVDPALSQLNIRYNNIAKTKIVGASAATVSTLALSLSMLLNPTVAASIAVVGTGGLVASFREYEDYKKQNAALRENPWYLLWKLRRELAK
jgi:hypothetical protein